MSSHVLTYSLLTFQHLFTILLNKITSNNHNVKNRQSVLILISKIVHVTPVWLSQIITQNRLNHFFSILRVRDDDSYASITFDIFTE